MKTTVFITVLFLLTACLNNLSKAENKKAYMQCRLEIYCTKSQDSLIKKSAFKAMALYFKTELSNGICEKHYQPWGLDYRKPAVERCGLGGGFNDR